MPRKYLFIDGGFFRRFVCDMKKAAEPDLGDLEIDFTRVGSGYDRILFYDAYPEQKAGQSDEEFQDEMAETKRYFGQISRVRNFNIRPALTRRGQKREQKGVDVLLAIECLMHAIRNNIDEATVMTSDLDFFPLFEALLQTKTKSLLRYQFKRTAVELTQAADHAIPLTGHDFRGWLSPQHAELNREVGLGVTWRRDAEAVGSGTIAEKQFVLLKHRHEDTDWYFAIVDGELSGNVLQSRLFVEGYLETTLRAPLQYV